MAPFERFVDFNVEDSLITETVYFHYKMLLPTGILITEQ